MKTYTFKIKLQYPSEKYPAILSVIHCPLEVFFDSLKEFKQLEELYKILIEPSNKEIPSLYITASDYLDSFGHYVGGDNYFCDYKAALDSNSLAELLLHHDCLGFVEDISKPTTKTTKKSKKKAVKNDEV